MTIPDYQSIMLPLFKLAGDQQEYKMHDVTDTLADSPLFFERLVVELLVKMGYGGFRKDAGEAIGKSGDEGIDYFYDE